jgi:pimeloyl-ACP methyl ester carboxylesterase
MDRLEVDGVDLAYALQGAEAGRSVVILHGLIASSREWTSVSGGLAAAGWRVLSVDAPGHGASSSPRDASHYGGAGVAGLVHQLARSLGCLPAVVVGHSWGGLIAEEFAIANPDDTAALVLVDSAGGGPRAYVRPPNADAIWANEAAVAFERGMEALWQLHQDEGLWARATHLPPKTQAFLKARFCATSPEGYVFGNQALGERRNTLGHLSRLKTKALIICGEHEEPLMAQTSRDLAGAIDGTRLAIIPKAGHSPHLENPRAFFDVLQSFVAEMDPDRSARA